MAKITLYLKDAQIRSEVSGILTSGMVGVEVELVCDESWEDLSKTLVCRAGDVVKTVLVQNDRAVVAHETMVAGKWLELGVEGINDDGSVLIPTLWERCCIVLPGADSSADATVDPTMPIWMHLQKRVESLEVPPVPSDIGALPTPLAAKVGQYLRVADVNNIGVVTQMEAVDAPEQSDGTVKTVNGVAPDESGNVEITIPDSSQNVDLTDYAKEQWVREGFQPKGDYLANTELTNAVNTALAQAKESGVFDGSDGQPGADGSPGKDGISATHSWNGTVLTVTSASGTSSADLKGDKGDKGDTGATGPRGEKGEPGEDGADYALTDADKVEIAAKVPIVKVAEQPIFVGDISECADTTKLYVLPDGFVYAYMQTVTIVPGETVANFTNLLKTSEAEIRKNMRYSHSGGVFKNNPGSDAIILPIPTSGTVTMRFRNCGVYVLDDGSSYASVYLGTDKTTFPANTGVALANWLKDANGDYYFTFTNSTGDKYLTCTMLPFDDTAIITANEEIVYAESEGTETISYEWKNTGIAFVSSGVTPGSGNVLYGKKIVTCGDSFTAGSASYPAHIANRNNMTLVNMAVAGSKLTNIADSSQTPFSVDLYKNVPADADYIIISFGLNEIGDFNELGDTLVGTKSDTENTTIWGAYNVVFTHLITRNPFAKIGVIIPDAWMTDAYATIIRNICAYWGIPYLDLKGTDTPLGIGGKYTEMSDTAKSLRNTAFQTSDSDAHPNEKAHEYRSTFIENFLRSL